MEDYLQQFSDWLTLKNYSKKTKKAYLCALRQFWRFCQQQEKATDFDKSVAVKTYLLHRFEEQKVAWQTVNGDYSALRLFFVNILGREWDERKLPRPRKQKSLPKVITPEQVMQLIDHAATFKHRVFFSLLYATGMRLGEALNLRVEDVDAAGMRILVRDGKGHKDRYTLLSVECLDLLRFYFRAFHPTGGWLFNGKYAGTRWSPKGAQHAFMTARRKAKLPEFVTAHTLRHCFATHLLQSGIDLVTIQQLLGHKYLKTTVRYIHLNQQHFQQIDNPSDRISAWQKIIDSAKSSATTDSGLSNITVPIRPYAVPSAPSDNAAPNASAANASPAERAVRPT